MTSRDDGNITDKSVGSRVVGKTIDLNEDGIVSFFDARAARHAGGEIGRNMSVLLGDEDVSYADRWDAYEKGLILPLLAIQETDAVLDIGCGVGRWAQSVLPLCESYVGVDASHEMVRVASASLGDEWSDKATFYNASFQELFDLELSSQSFDVVILSEVCMYLGDADMADCITRLSHMLSPGGRLYYIDSVARGERLTLDGIWSDNLGSRYSAIYRAPEECRKLLTPLFDTGTAVSCGWLNALDKDSTPETGHWYVVVQKDA